MNFITSSMAFEIKIVSCHTKGSRSIYIAISSDELSCLISNVQQCSYYLSDCDHIYTD